ncbi:Alb1-domain-containing protein [Echria macrotheca]|uniref:Alb1-domain-containing protein n=1 Tax=Echria macrotheca TaxID=438768 RepID=A0AAJ0FG96_9PEZI|nr:Alb1-domain-containing protein [Echria macrotheca]
MAKGGISKPRKGASQHSRAARRATSPSIDTDKSLKNVKPPQELDDRRPSVLAVHQASGVSKKSKRKTAMSSKARKRHERSMDKAEAVMDRTATKVQRSKGSLKVIQARKRTWDEINKDTAEVVAKKKRKGPDTTAEDEAVAKFYDDDDEEMVEASSPVRPSDAQPVPEATAPPALDEDEDEIL